MEWAARFRVTQAFTPKPRGRSRLNCSCLTEMTTYSLITRPEKLSARTSSRTVGTGSSESTADWIRLALKLNRILTRTLHSHHDISFFAGDSLLAQVSRPLFWNKGAGTTFTLDLLMDTRLDLNRFSSRREETKEFCRVPIVENGTLGPNDEPQEPRFERSGVLESSD